MPRLKDALEGRPFRTPLHPAFVHLPIALFPLSLALDVATRTIARPDLPLERAAFYCLVVGIVTALLAAVFGIVDYTSIRDDHPAKKTATAHMLLNLVAVGIFAVGAGLRFGTLDQRETAALPLLLSLAGVAVLSYSGYLGGVLVYDDGIAVGRHRRSTPLPASTISIQTAGQPTSIGPESQLADGHTWRVDVDGVAATVIRLDGEVYAFQEYCTHRYGPLSEGKFANCEVTCPWHASRFDVRTGEVRSGPAKVGLRTFRVEVRDGQVVIFPPTK